MTNFTVNNVNVVPFPKPCEICDSRKNVGLFAGLMVCANCQKYIRMANPDMFSTKNLIEEKNQD